MRDTGDKVEQTIINAKYLPPEKAPDESKKFKVFQTELENVTGIVVL